MVTSKNRFAKDKFSDTKQFEAEKLAFSGSNRQFLKRRIEKCSRKFVREAIFRGCHMYRKYLITTLITIFIITALFSITSGQSTEKLEFKKYKYERWTTTGISNYIRIDDKPIAIRFNENSNKRELNLLHLLPRGIFWGSKHNKVYLIGKLHHEVKKVPLKGNDGSVLAAGGEFYREFELKSWYIVCPFLELNLDELEYIKRNKLTYKDLGFSWIAGTLSGVRINKHQKKGNN